MPIVPSRAERIRTLVRQLASGRAAERDSAVAQLTLMGPRAVVPLRVSLDGAPVEARRAALEVLERLDDSRALPVIHQMVGDGSRAVAVRAMELTAERPDPRGVAALAAVLSGTPAKDRARATAAVQALVRMHGGGLVEALAPLLDTLIDEGAPRERRLAILDALARLEPPLPRSTLRPLARRLAESKEPALVERAEELAGRRPAREGGLPDAVTRLTTGGLSDDEARALATSLTGAGDRPAEQLVKALDETDDPGTIQGLAVAFEVLGGASAIPALKRALGRLTEAPADSGGPEPRLAARAAVHSALARRDSRVALHDLREMIASHPPGLMPALLETAASVGDGSLVPALARAASEDLALLKPCADAYATIAHREKLRRTSPALRKVRAADRPVLDAFFEAAGRRRR